MAVAVTVAVTVVRDWGWVFRSVWVWVRVRVRLGVRIRVRIGLALAHLPRERPPLRWWPAPPSPRPTFVATVHIDVAVTGAHTSAHGTAEIVARQKTFAERVAAMPAAQSKPRSAAAAAVCTASAVAAGRARFAIGRSKQGRIRAQQKLSRLSRAFR